MVWIYLEMKQTNSFVLAIKIAIYSSILGAITGELTFVWCVNEGLCKSQW